MRRKRPPRLHPSKPERDKLKIQKLIAAAGALSTQIRKRTFLPTLIVAESSGAVVWKKELEECTALKPRIKLFYGQHGKANNFKQANPTILDLLKDILALPDDPTALETYYLTTYNTWHQRSLAHKDGVVDVRVRRKRGEEDDGDEQDEEVPNKDRGAQVSLCEGVFGRL
ncbi:MAG: hypothetical protein Q9168_002984 [Polycauliona sp. 1 TL-2023]